MARYAVFDDVPFERLIGARSFLGCQSQFTITDKYMPKTRLDWGKPSIFLMNRDADYRDRCEPAFLEFIQGNCVIFDQEWSFF